MIKYSPDHKHASLLEEAVVAKAMVVLNYMAICLDRIKSGHRHRLFNNVIPLPRIHSPG